MDDHRRALNVLRAYLLERASFDLDQEASVSSLRRVSSRVRGSSTRTLAYAGGGFTQNAGLG